MSRTVRTLRVLALALVALCGLPDAGVAQSDILLQLRSGSPQGDRFRVDSAGGVIARSFLGIGIIPTTGAGERMMWHPFKAAFRVGGVSSTEWDDSNIGFYSFASGYNANAAGNYSTAGGYDSNAGGSYSTAFGYLSNATGQASVALGYRTTADANYGVAIGQRASTNGFTGAIVLSDASTTDSIEASANNQFSLRAAGGIRLFSNATKTTGVSVSAGGSSWNVISDRSRKENFLDVDGETLLLRLRDVPVTSWNYIDEGRDVRHIGPMAQDWNAALSLNDDPLTINMSDLDGVNLAAIRALETRTASQSDRLVEQSAQIRRLEQEVARLRTVETELAELRAVVRVLTERTPTR